MPNKLKQRVLKQEELRKSVTDEFSADHENALLRIRAALHRAVSEADDKACGFSASDVSGTGFDRCRKSSWELIKELHQRIEVGEITHEDGRILDSLPPDDLKLLDMTPTYVVCLYGRVYASC